MSTLIPEGQMALQRREAPGGAASLSSWVWFFSFVLLGTLADIATKSWAFGAVPPGPQGRITVIEGFFYIVRATNTGAMWSLFQGVEREIWIAVRGGVFLVLLGMVLRMRPTSLTARAGFALVLAGALGNLYDNVFFDEGAVRDWLRFDFGEWTFPIFNLADAFICIGAPLLLLHFNHDGEKEEGGEAAA